MDDSTRVGALRLRRTEPPHAWVDERERGAPPATRLRELEAIARKLGCEDAEQRPEYTRWLAQLVAPGTSMGGARPKATFADELGLWNRIPGTQDDGTLDGEVLESWIKEARTLAKAAGREDVADGRIGSMLSASPMGADGNWPAEPVREMIDLFRSKSMIEGFRIGTSNRRGVTTRSPRDGGELERQEAAKYRAWTKAIAFEHPHTAKALDALADEYDCQARREDEDAERLDREI